MEKKEAHRLYKISDAELVTTTREKLNAARRDKAEFDKRNIKEATHFAQLEAELDAFSNLPTDEELEAIQKEATEIKGAVKTSLKEKIRTIRTACENLFGAKSATTARFCFKGLEAMKDPELFKCGRRVVRTATKMLAKLSSEGITIDFIAELKTITDSFEDAFDEQLDAINDRDIAREERIEAGNFIYKKLVRLCNTGKDIWVATSEAKYNDYVIYEAGTWGSKNGNSNK